MIACVVCVLVAVCSDCACGCVCDCLFAVAFEFVFVIILWGCVTIALGNTIAISITRGAWHQAPTAHREWQGPTAHRVNGHRVQSSYRSKGEWHSITVATSITTGQW